MHQKVKDVGCSKCHPVRFGNESAKHDKVQKQNWSKGVDPLPSVAHLKTVWSDSNSMSRSPLAKSENSPSTHPDN